MKYRILCKACGKVLKETDNNKETFDAKCSCGQERMAIEEIKSAIVQDLNFVCMITNKKTNVTKNVEILIRASDLQGKNDKEAKTTVINKLAEGFAELMTTRYLFELMEE